MSSTVYIVYTAPVFPDSDEEKIGILLVNLGTPRAPDKASVRTYLNEFLSDTRVVERPPILWQPILKGIILNTRPGRSAKAYRKVWTDEGSPLLLVGGGSNLVVSDAGFDGTVVHIASRGIHVHAIDACGGVLVTVGLSI